LFYSVHSSEVFLLIFCLDDNSIGDTGILRYSTITVSGSICDLRSISVYFNVVVCSYIWCIYAKN
jgi:hypothetical protein